MERISPTPQFVFGKLVYNTGRWLHRAAPEGHERRSQMRFRPFARMKILAVSRV